ncbi:protein of unknown function DUF336 [Desulfatibacillum aliphaticivorans]|uniref:Heme-binding protein n=1 Tax=Desulfatibacillum aliphaticivorans TaxID=218208 RepID=B8FDM8_DESAL|nr:heme-binding protein [Desulfatibacillum aliphaticivorans]ACL06659.1 protein of unknown function DUF336 [Desulfatibacillum aliphaticivorans]
MEIMTHICNDLARVLARIARKKALEIQVPMVIAFADARGELVHFQRMDKALPVSSDIAVNKAFTAAALRMSTHKVGRLVEQGQELAGLELTNKGKMVIFGGGLPLSLDGEVVGSVGVSGGSVAQDMVVAQAAANALEQMEKTAQALLPILPKTLEDLTDLANKIQDLGRKEGADSDILEGAFYLI